VVLDIFVIFIVELPFAVLSPSVREVLFNFVSNFLLDWHSFVLLRNQREEPVQLVIFVVLLVLFLDFVEHVDEDSHDVGKNHDPKEHEQSNEAPFNVALRVVVSKTNGRQSSEGVVNECQNVLSLILLH
jgi:hypothetical protein